MTKLDSILKGRDITLSTKVCLVKAMVFPVVMYGCESWVIKKAEHRRIDAFELWCWRSLLRVPWTARRSNQSIVKEISPEYSLEAETPILWPPDVKSWLVWKYPDTGTDWGQEEKGTTEDEIVGCHHWHNGHGFGWTLGVGVGQGGLVYCGSWGRKESDTTERLNWTKLKWCTGCLYHYFQLCVNLQLCHSKRCNFKIECFIKKIFERLPRNQRSDKLERFLNGVGREHRSCRRKTAFQK